MKFKRTLSAGAWFGAFAAGLFVPAQAHAQAQDAEQANESTEIVVTANRREQDVQDVPASLSVLGAQEIEDRGIASMNEYLEGVPSVTFQGGQTTGRNKVVIRGVTGDLEAREERTTGVYFGEAPISALGERGFSDPRLVDIDRVEVLRGPQGTLYGAGAMGGAVRIIPSAPDATDWDYSLGFAGSATEGGGDSSEFTGAVNIPIVRDQLAVRIVGYNYDTAGFIDNVHPGIPLVGAPPVSDEDVNDENTTGARVALRWTPTPNFDATLTYLMQDSQTGGFAETQPAIAPDLTQYRGTAESLSDNFDLFNLEASYDFGGIELTSVTTSAEKEDSENFDISEFFFGLAPILYENDTDSEFFSQEFRLSSTNEDSPLFWVAGAYYSDRTLNPRRRSNWYGNPLAIEPTIDAIASALLGAPVNVGVSTEDQIYFYDATLNETQFAAFADATYSFDNKLSVGVGLRWASYEYERAETQGGFFATFDANGVFDAPAETTEEDVLLPRVNITYEPTDNALYYVQAAEGFRVGRVNLPLPLTCEGELNAIGLTTGVNPGLDPVPASANSDSLWSYEAGAKFSGSRYTLNLATYYLDWSDIQSQFLGGCGFEFFYNGGSASITGAELEFSVDITDGFSFGLAASYNDAQLEEDATLGTSVQGAAGDRLPGVPVWDVRANARYEWDIASDLQGYVRADWSYTGDYLSAFPGDSFQSGDYEIANAAIGVETPTVNIQLFADNLLDERAQLSGNDTSFAFSPRLTIGRPRTVGIRLSVQR